MSGPSEQTKQLCYHGGVHIFTPTRPTATTDVPDDVPALTDVVAKVRANLREHYTLVYTSYDDRFRPQQIDIMLHDEDMWMHQEFSGVSEWEADERHRSATNELRELLSDEEWAVLEDEDDTLDELRTEVMDRDDSTWFDDMLGNTHNMLFRYSLDTAVDVDYTSDEDQRERAINDMMACFSDVTDPAALRATLAGMLPEASYGGNLTVLFYDGPKQWYRAMIDAANGKRVQVTFRDFYLLIHDGWSGSGYDTKIEGASITLDFDADKLCTDVGGPGYSWTSIAVPYEPAYAADITITTTEKD